MSSIVNAHDFDDEEFRVSLGTMETSGKRKWIYPKKPSGKFTNYRTYVSWFLLAFMFLAPFIKINGNQFLKFDVLNSEFFLFSFPFFPQDFYLLAVGVIATLVFIVLFTQIYGRLFCGWVCPQTIFLEMVFRRIEYAIEGDRPKQMKLDAQEWNSDKIMKKALKWTVFLLIAFAIANLFLAYVVGSEKVVDLVKSGPFANPKTLTFVLVFTGVFYFIFAWFREQACVLVCPYGRLQGVLVDKKTVAVTYDFKRGESKNGRARFKRDEDREAVGKGDCIDCKQCVVVCPTGIDIRNGTQLECVNCTACIDACDDVMVKIGLPTGLIRYASDESIEKNEEFRLTPRHYFFSAVLVGVIAAFFVLLSFRPSVDSKFFQKSGVNYELRDGNIINQYNYVLINKTNTTQKLSLKLISHDGKLKILNHKNGTITIERGKKIEGSMVITIPKKSLNSYMERLTIETLDDKGKEIDSKKIIFQGPMIYR